MQKLITRVPPRTTAGGKLPAAPPVASADAASAVAASVAASADATSVAWLLARRHVDVFVLDGGYRAYRRHLRELFEQGPRVIVVGGGRTSVGKTRALRAFAAKNYQVLDLEALAAHSGSVFGDLKGAAQPSNAAF